MATESEIAVIPSSADVHGMSVVTASRSQKAPRSGLIYNPQTLAAAVPVWFHPTPEGRYLGIFSLRWTEAVLSARTIKDVLLYGSHETSASPCWTVITPSTGDCDPVTLIPSERPGVRRVVAATSRGEMLFILNAYKTSEDAYETSALLQNFRIARTGITLLGEEMVPRDLAAGIYTDRRHLWVIGSDGSGGMEMARKAWSRIGTDADANPVHNWQYWGRGGWASDIKLASSVLGEKGTKIPLEGSASIARYRDAHYMMVTAKEDQDPTTQPGEGRLSVVCAPNNGRVYVADYLDDSVIVIDPSSKKILSRLRIVRPWQMVFNSTGTRLYVANRLDGTIKVVDPAKNTLIAEIVSGRAVSDFVFHPSQDLMYVSHESDRMISVVDLNTNQTTSTVSVGGSPTGMAVFPVTVSENQIVHYLYVSNTADKTISVINLSTLKVVKTIPTGYTSSPQAMCKDSDYIYVTSTDSLLVVNPVVNRVVAVFPLVNAGISIASHPEEDCIYVANALDYLTVFSTSTNTTSSTIALGTDLGRIQIALSPDGSKIYATNAQNQTLTIINTNDLSVDSVVPLDESLSSAVSQNLNPILNRIVALIGGVVNGFLPLDEGAVVPMVADLLNQAVSVITEQSGDVGTDALTKVEQILQVFAGLVPETNEETLDPVVLLEDVFRLISGVTSGDPIPNLIQDFLGTLTEVVSGSGPMLPAVELLEQIIRELTGILTGTGSSGGESSPSVTIAVGNASLTPRPLWRSDAYVSRRVDQYWTKHGFSKSIPGYLPESGVRLQENISLTPGYGVRQTSASVTELNLVSQAVQVFTGTSPHTVVLPPVSKPVGTTTTTEGAVIVPDEPLNFFPTLSISDASVKEGSFAIKVVTFRVSLSSSTTNRVTVKYVTGLQDSDTATPGQDYTATSGELVFPPGIVSQQIRVDVTGDFETESNEFFTVRLFSPTGCEIDDPIAVCTIVNDDRRTLIDVLMQDLKSIVNGLASGTVQSGTAVNSAVTSILERAIRTMTNTVGQTGQTVTTLVDHLTKMISGEQPTPPAGFVSLPQLLAGTVAEILGNAAQLPSTAADLANDLLSIVSTTLAGPQPGIVAAFQALVASLAGTGGGGETITPPTAPGIVPAFPAPEPVRYMPYTIHNQSTQDIVVMASSRDRSIVVPRGTGMTFTPQTAEPTTSGSWSWSTAIERSPRARQGFPYYLTTLLAVRVYSITIGGTPSSGMFRLIHNGRVSEPIVLNSSQATMTDSVRTAIASMGTIPVYTVTGSSPTSFTVTVPEDQDQLQLYSSRLVGGSSPSVLVTMTESDSTLLTRWGALEPDPKPAEPTAAATQPKPSAATEVPVGLADLVTQFSKLLKVINSGLVSVNPGAVSSVTGLVEQTVRLITGEDISAGTSVVEQVTELLQKLAPGSGEQDLTKAAASFESILRQITGGTGSTASSDVPDPMAFLSDVLESTTEAAEDLADALQRIFSAIVR